jgi:hypothetical protein
LKLVDNRQKTDSELQYQILFDEIDQLQHNYGTWWGDNEPNDVRIKRMEHWLRYTEFYVTVDLSKKTSEVTVYCTKKWSGGYNRFYLKKLVALLEEQRLNVTVELQNDC